MDASDPMYDDLYENYNGLVRNFISQLKELELQIKGENRYENVI